jgi:hypothetical protein
MPGGRDLGDMLRAIQSLDLPTIGEQVLENQADIILQRNKDQLYRGETTDGGRLPPYKSEAYAIEKNILNPLPGLGHADHYLTGAFYEAFVVDISGGVLHIESHDPKALTLEERAGYGDQQAGADLTYGLGEKEHDEYIEEDYKPGFYEQVHRDLKLL